ncbi:MAG: hypothetical protein M3O30_00910 [Planctomycetota bacterium]|nr:hypothetical protein [Planctomycetota bacterium]
MPLFAIAQSLPSNSGSAGAWQQSTPPAAVGGDAANNSIQVYDLGPVMARAAFADSEYDNANANLNIAVSRTRKDFDNSPDVVAARQKLQDAQKTYDNAAAQVMADVAKDPNYQNLVDHRSELDAAISQTVSPAARADLARQKLDISATLSHVRAVALAEAMKNDSALMQAKDNVALAQQQLADKLNQHDSAFYDNQHVAGAWSNLQNSRSMRAAAQGYLQGALITRSDIIATDERHNPNYGNIAAGGFDPYNSGYFGVGGVITTSNGFSRRGF